ncbi:DUF2970 domain-containing protein [Aliikangiella coralliicola]|uniref:DUF2970 domain-containing protein n=1 Tax=Aliikangiella coralliicola TaxID=2592383 RepID=A0A545UJ33_9GAMM|nr:DUF2970 domain-containing protein [Aliikangiella coralliicola]TQV89443.1 DUF2970 domain-containing protein [Aliikangiella coralliicola]
MQKLNKSTNSDAGEKLGILTVIQSVIAAMFGVRNSDKHKKDFEQGDAAQFIVVGIIFVFAFVLTIQWIVSMILEGQP